MHPDFGTFVTGTITLEIPAPFGGLTGNLTSVNGQLSTSKWAVPAGQTTCTFQVATNDVAAAAQMSVTATLGPQSLTASTAVQPNRITSFVVSPTTFIGLSRTKVVGTISIAAPVAYDVYVNGTSTKSGLAALPGLITIPAGTSSATVTLTHGKANNTTVVTVTATRAGASKAVNLTVK